MARFLALALLSAAFAAQTACDSGSNDNTPDQVAEDDLLSEDSAGQTDLAQDSAEPQEDLTAPDDTYTPPEDVAQDLAVEELALDTQIEEDLTPPKDEYAPPPYGVVANTTIKNHSFYDPKSNSVVKLSSLYQHPEKKVLVISSAAEWCSACKSEAWALKSFYDTYSPKGAEIWYLLFEDKDGLPVDVPSWQRWMNQINPNYPTYMDSSFETGLYFQASATPMNMVVDLSNMRIVYLVTGYDETGMENAVKKVLGL